MYSASTKLHASVCPPEVGSEAAKQIRLLVAEGLLVGEGARVDGSLDSLQISLGDKAEEISAHSISFSDLVLAS